MGPISWGAGGSFLTLTEWAGAKRRVLGPVEAPSPAVSCLGERCPHSHGPAGAQGQRKGSGSYREWGRMARDPTRAAGYICSACVVHKDA